MATCLNLSPPNWKRRLQSGLWGGVRHGRVAGAGVSFSECAIRLRSFRVRSLPGKGFLVPAVEHRIFDVELVGQVAGEMGGQMRTGALSG